MLVANHWNHDDWKSDDARRFWIMLFASATFHGVLLFAWKLPAPVWKAADAAVLTVVLRGAVTMVVEKPPAPETARDTAVIVRTDVAPARFSVPPRPAVPAPAVPAAPRQPPASAGEQGTPAIRSAPGRSSNVPRAPVGVAVMLVIDERGRANQIFWDSLPALTDEQLRRVELAIRARRYAPGQTVKEVFDVREFLKLAPARAENETGPEPAPTVD